MTISHTHSHKLKINDIVFIINATPVNKLANSYKRPYRIIEFTSKNMAVIKPLQKNTQIHIYFIKVGYRPNSINS